MKIKSLLGVFVFSLCVICSFPACDGSDEVKEPQPLTFEKSDYEAMIGRNTSIYMRSGNLDYSLSVADQRILDASVYEGDVIGRGLILVQGKQKGATTLTVVDNVTKEAVELNIRVTEGYIAFRVVDSDHPALEKDVWLYLVNNEARDCYFFGSGEGVGSPASLLARGKYGFSTQKEGEASIPCLSLGYQVDGNGKLTLDNTAVALEHKFDISGSTRDVYDIIKQFLDVNWRELPKVQQSRDVERVYFLYMKEVGHDYKVTSIFSPASIPEGVLE